MSAIQPLSESDQGLPIVLGTTRALVHHIPPRYIDLIRGLLIADVSAMDVAVTIEWESESGSVIRDYIVPKTVGVAAPPTREFRLCLGGPVNLYLHADTADAVLIMGTVSREAFYG